MGQKAKPNFNLYLLLGIGLLIVGLFIYKQLRESLFLGEKDRITVAVFGAQPYVYSYNPTKKLAFVVQFDPEAQLNVPGGYGWYRLGSLDLLGKIEGKRALLLQRAFGELIGAPVDYVYYPKKAALVERSEKNFQEYYLHELKKIHSKKYTHSITNWIDRLLVRGIFAVREDRLVFIDTADLVSRHGKEWRYDSELLDSRLKGLFYRESFLSSGLRAIIVTRTEAYLAAKRLLRQIEGSGIKVIEIEVNDALENKHCQIKGASQLKPQVRALALTYNCQAMRSQSAILQIVLDSSLEKEFRYN